MLAVLLLGVVVVGSMVADALPRVPKDKAGEDNWEDPLAIDANKNGLMRVLIPDCAASPITRIVLWDENSKPYWEVSGRPTPMAQFVLGFTPEGFSVDVPWTKPANSATLRLVAFRRVGGPIGLRFSFDDLTEGRVMGGMPLASYSVDGWKKASVCGSGSDTSTVTATTAGT
jgi:hypothetical protein